MSQPGQLTRSGYGLTPEQKRQAIELARQLRNKGVKWIDIGKAVSEQLMVYVSGAKIYGWVNYRDGLRIMKRENKLAKTKNSNIRRSRRLK